MIAEEAFTAPKSSLVVEKAEPKEVTNETFTMGAEKSLSSLRTLSDHEDSGEEGMGANEFKAPTTFYPNGRPRAIPFPLKVSERIVSPVLRAESSRSRGLVSLTSVAALYFPILAHGTTLQ